MLCRETKSWKYSFKYFLNTFSFHNGNTVILNKYELTISKIVLNNRYPNKIQAIIRYFSLTGLDAMNVLVYHDRGICSI